MDDNKLIADLIFSKIKKAEETEDENDILSAISSFSLIKKDNETLNNEVIVLLRDYGVRLVFRKVKDGMTEHTYFALEYKTIALQIPQYLIDTMENPP